MNAPSGSTARVSVIIPVYGTAPFVKDALDSVLGQTFTDYETIVVNDGSPDTKLLDNILRPYRDRITYIVQENRGSSAARNTALKVARGHYVAMLDSDDYWSSEYLASQLSVLDSDPTIDVVYPDAVWIGSDGKTTRQFSKEHPVGGDISFLRVLARECQVYGGVTARRETLFRIGLYDEDLSTGEDFDLWLRILKAGGRIAYNDRVLAYFRERAGSLTSNRVALARDVLKLLHGLPDKMDLSVEERAVLDRQVSSVAGQVNLTEGRLAFLAGDRATALSKFTAAAKYRKSWKLLAAIASLRIAPGLLLQFYRLRERWDRSRSGSVGSAARIS